MSKSMPSEIPSVSPEPLDDVPLTLLLSDDFLERSMCLSINDINKAKHNIKRRRKKYRNQNLHSSGSIIRAI